jgi:hypothetical protein
MNKFLLVFLLGMAFNGSIITGWMFFGMFKINKR